MELIAQAVFGQLEEMLRDAPTIWVPVADDSIIFVSDAGDCWAKSSFSVEEAQERLPFPCFLDELNNFCDSAQPLPDNAIAITPAIAIKVIDPNANYDQLVRRALTPADLLQSERWFIEVQDCADQFDARSKDAFFQSTTLAEVIFAGLCNRRNSSS